MQWESDLIGYDASKSYGSPGYYAQSLFGEFVGTEVSTSQSTNTGDRFFYSSTADPAKGEVYLKLVNAGSTPQPVNLQFDGAKPLEKAATLYSLGGTNPAITNSITDPKRVVPVKSTLKVSSTFEHTVPPYTIQVMVLHSR